MYSKFSIIPHKSYVSRVPNNFVTLKFYGEEKVKSKKISFIFIIIHAIKKNNRGK